MNNAARDNTSYNFFVRNWTYIKLQKYNVLIDEKDNYISFVSEKFFEEIASVLENVDINDHLQLKEIVKLAKLR